MRRIMTRGMLLCGCLLVTSLVGTPGAAQADAELESVIRTQESAYWMHDRADYWMQGPATYTPPPGEAGLRVTPANEQAVIWRALDPDAAAPAPRSAMDWARDFGKLLILLSVPMAFAALQVTLHRQLRQRQPPA